MISADLNFRENTRKCGKQGVQLSTCFPSMQTRNFPSPKGFASSLERRRHDFLFHSRDAK
jgi:hypothetical protein